MKGRRKHLLMLGAILFPVVAFVAASRVWCDHALIAIGIFLPMLALLGAIAATAEHALTRLRDEQARRDSLETQLQHAQKLAAMGHLTGGIAHDFRNILSIIVGNLDLLTVGRGDPTPRIERAMEAANRGVNIIQSMMSFVRQTPTTTAYIDLNEVIRSPMLQQAVGSTIGLQLKPCDRPCHTRVERTQLELALLNIILNACDAMPNGGPLIMQTDRRHLHGEHNLTGPYVRLRIIDTGIGMPPEIVEKILQPFFTTKDATGTGLGLSMVDDFVKQAKGAIDIASTVGQGTTITIYLPESHG